MASAKVFFYELWERQRAMNTHAGQLTCRTLADSTIVCWHLRKSQSITFFFPDSPLWIIVCCCHSLSLVMLLYQPSNFTMGSWMLMTCRHGWHWTQDEDRREGKRRNGELVSLPLEHVCNTSVVPKKVTSSAFLLNLPHILQQTYLAVSCFIKYRCSFSFRNGMTSVQLGRWSENTVKKKKKSQHRPYPVCKGYGLCSGWENHNISQISLLHL